MKIDELYTMLNCLIVYCPLDCTSGYHHIALLPDMQWKYAFVMLIGKFEFKKVLFGLAQVPTDFQQLKKYLGSFLCF